MNNDQTDDGSPLTLRGWRPYFLFFAAGFLLYAHALSFGLTWFDDNVLLLQNGPVLSSAGNLAGLFATNVFMSENGQFYRPLLNVSFMLDTLAGGPQFLVFHLTNLLAHILSVSLLFLVLLRLGSTRTAAFLLSLLFLVHPAAAQTACWIPGRNDSLLFIFSALSFLGFAGFLAEGSRLSFAAFPLFFMAALLTKETALTLPAAAACYLALFADKAARPRAWAALAAGTVLPAAAWLLLRSAAIRHAPSLGPALLLNILRDSPALPVLLGKAVLPLDPQVWTTLAAASPAYGLAAAAALAAAAGYAAGPRRKTLYFGLSWFFLFLVPSLAAAKGALRTAFVYEQRLYLPLAGLMIFLSGLKWFEPGFARPGRLALYVSPALLGFALISFTHSYNFSGPLFFWERAVQESPSSPEARLNLGLAYYLARSPGAAERQYLAALELNPLEPLVHNNLGQVYADRGEPGRAEKEFLRELEVNPGYRVAGENLRKVRLRAAGAGNGRGKLSRARR